MTEGGITRAIKLKARLGLKCFRRRTTLHRVIFVKRKNVDGGEHVNKHAEAKASLERLELLTEEGEEGPKYECKTFVQDGACLELLLEPSPEQDPRSIRQVTAIRFSFRNGGYAFWVPDADLNKFPCSHFGPRGDQSRMVARLVLENQAPERQGCSFVLCETSEAINYSSISAEVRDLLPGEVLGSIQWRRRVYKCGPDVYEDPEGFRREVLASLVGTGELFGGDGMRFAGSHEEQAKQPWFIILFATRNGFWAFGTAGRSEIVGCVWYELGLDVGVPISVFRGNPQLARDLVNIVVKLADDLACLDDRYDPMVCSFADMAIMRCNMMVCYQQKGHYLIGPKEGTKKSSDVHGKFWTPPITSCETAAVLNEYSYCVMTLSGPLKKHGGSANKLFYGPASWTTNGPKGDRKLFETVEPAKPKPEPQGEDGERKRKREGWRARRKRMILSGSYVSETPRREVEPPRSKVEGDLVGTRIQVLWEKGSHPDIMEEDLYFTGLVHSHNATKGTHHIIYDDFSQEDEHLNELKYIINGPEGEEEVVGPNWVPHGQTAKRGKRGRGRGKGKQ